MVLPWQQTKYHSTIKKKIEQFPVIRLRFSHFYFQIFGRPQSPNIIMDGQLDMLVTSTLLQQLKSAIISNFENLFNRLKINEDSFRWYQLAIKSGFNFENDYHFRLKKKLPQKSFNLNFAKSSHINLIDGNGAMYFISKFINVVRLSSDAFSVSYFVVKL